MTARLIPAKWLFRDPATRLACIASWAYAHGYRLTARKGFTLFLERIA